MIASAKNKIWILSTIA